LFFGERLVEGMNNKKKRCATCERDIVLTAFYSTTSKMFQDGKVPICKKCISEQINEEDIASVKRILRQIDKPYIHTLWESSKLSKNDTFGVYMKNINSLQQYKGLTYDDSVEEKMIEKPNTKEKENHSTNYTSDFKVTEKIIDKWGFGYEPEEYQQFERKYSKLINNYGEKTALHTEGLISYIRFRVKEEFATARGEYKEAKEWGTLASKQAQDAKINVSQLSKSDISGGVDVVSQLFEAVENEVSIIPLLPKVLEQPMDDVDMVLWATVNYNRRLEDKSMIAYREIWDFYDEMLEEFFHSKGFNEQQKRDFRDSRNSVFRDLSEVYIEPLYDDDDEMVEGGEEDGELQELSE
jgi:hypothetical protein